MIKLLYSKDGKCRAADVTVISNGKKVTLYLLTNSIPLNTHCTVQQIIINKPVEFYGIILNEKKNYLSQIWKKLIFNEKMKKYRFSSHRFASL